MTWLTFQSCLDCVLSMVTTDLPTQTKALLYRVSLSYFMLIPFGVICMVSFIWAMGFIMLVQIKCHSSNSNNIPSMYFYQNNTELQTIFQERRSFIFMPQLMLVNLLCYWFYSTQCRAEITVRKWHREFHETCQSVTFIVLVNSHQRWKQTRNRVCFHLWCELTLALRCRSIILSRVSK